MTSAILEIDRSSGYKNVITSMTAVILEIDHSSDYKKCDHLHMTSIILDIDRSSGYKKYRLATIGYPT